MLPDPLHPAVVHLPIALAVLIPFFAILGTGLIYKNLLPARSWILIVVLQAMLIGSGWVAFETGEHEEDRIEQIVAEDLIEEHEEGAERFLLLAGLGLLATGAGLFSGRAGSMGRIVGSVVTIAVLALAVSVGHSGGELVYKHGAANAYIKGPVDGSLEGSEANTSSGTIVRLKDHNDEDHD
jgi:uncharacterized membrane protein